MLVVVCVICLLLFVLRCLLFGNHWLSFVVCVRVCGSLLIVVVGWLLLVAVCCCLLLFVVGVVIMCALL